MGALFSSNRRKKTLHTLEELEKKIAAIEQYSYVAEQRKRRIVGLLMVFSMGIYVLTLIFFYFYARLATWREIVIYFTPLFLFPFLILLVRRVLTYYYEWRINSNKNKLVELKAEKKRILEDVMQNESYKYAKEILDKFGDNKESPPPPILTLNQSSPVRAVARTPQLSTPQLRQRQPGLQSNPNNALVPTLMSTPTKIGFEPMMGQSQMTPARIAQLPRPIMQSGGAFDRLVDYLIGDGPGSRFALICSKCTGHNGMALPEEFEFISYRCAYCNYHNPARKQKPKAPSLMATPVHARSLPPALDNNSGQENDTSDEEKNSAKDSDEDAIPTQLENPSTDCSENHPVDLPTAPEKDEIDKKTD